MNAIEFQQFSHEESFPVSIHEAKSILMAFRTLSDPIEVIKLLRRINGLGFRVTDEVVDPSQNKRRYSLIGPSSHKKAIIGEFLIPKRG